jgi:hypothetical protein
MGNKKLKIVGIVALGSAVLAGALFAGWSLRGAGDPNQNLFDEERMAAEYNYLSENFTGLSGPRVSLVSEEDFVRPVAGVDYVPEEVAAAFDEIYDIAGESEDGEDGGYRVVSGGDPQADSEPWVRPLRPDFWVDLGEAVAREAVRQQRDFEDSPLFVDLNDPTFWVALGDAVIEEIAGVSDSRDSVETAEVGTAEISRLAVEVFTLYAEEFGQAALI